MASWDERDHELGLREKFATLIASKVSGLSPEQIVQPTNDDLELADIFSDLIEKEMDS